MFSRIAIGVDGRTGGRDALSLAVRLAGATAAELTAVHVAHAARDGSPIDARPYEAMLERELAVAGVLGDTLVVGHEFPGDGLRDAVSRLGADLLVIGSSHRAGLGSVLRGRTARTALHGIACPVAIAPHAMHAIARDHRTIGVGYDGSPGARRALDVAAGLAREVGASLRVVAVGEPLDRLPAMAPDGEPWCPPEEQRAAGSRAMVAEAVDTVAATGVDVTGAVVPGFARDGLRRLSDTVDLLIVGACRYGPAGRLVLGGTAEHVLDTARCPVLVIPRAAPHAAAAAA